MLIVNLHAIHHDPKTFVNPEIFNPQRFIKPDGDVVKKPRIMPFESGKLHFVFPVHGFRMSSYVFHAKKNFNFAVQWCHSLFHDSGRKNKISICDDIEGKRKCVAESPAMMIIFLGATYLLQRFKFSKIPGVEYSLLPSPWKAVMDTPRHYSMRIKPRGNM